MKDIFQQSHVYIHFADRGKLKITYYVENWSEPPDYKKKDCALM
jgi:hypothetical protein